MLEINESLNGSLLQNKFVPLNDLKEFLLVKEILDEN
jgi:hypothetical protein